MIKSKSPERIGKHFICCCNRQTPGSNDYSIAQAVFRHTNNILELSQEQLSAEAHLSGASVSRFFRKCGFATFQDFKRQMELFLSRRNLHRHQKLLTTCYGLTDAELTARLCSDAVANLNATMESLNLDALRQVVEMLQKSRAVYFVGDNRDMYCFYSLQLDLMCNGKAAYFYNVDEISDHILPAMDSGTLLLLISVNPFWYNEEMKLLCQAARKEQAPVILFTQGEPYDGVEPSLCCRFGQPGSVNNGYYSLPLLAQVLSALYYRSL